MTTDKLSLDTHQYFPAQESIGFFNPKNKDSMTEKTYLSQIETPTGSYVARYPWATEMSIEQQSIFWPAEELGVE